MPDTYLYPQPPFYAGGYGIRTPFGLTLPPGSRVAAYVRSGGSISGADQDLNAQIVTTLNAGLARCRASAGDYVIVLPGHTETISGADSITSNMVAGTNILGIGEGSLRPTFTWSAAASTALLNDANCTWENAIFNLATDPSSTTGVTVAAPITVSAAGCRLSRMYMNFGVDADQICGVGIAVTGDNFTMSNVHAVGATAAECTTFLNISTCNNTNVSNCVFEGATSSTTVGIVRFAATAPLNMIFQDVTVVNRKAASVHAITGVASASGSMIRVNAGVLADGTTLLIGTSNGILQCYGCFIVNQAGETSMLPTVQST